MTDASDFLKKIDLLENKVRSYRLDISLNEIVDMIENRELNITPEYQRQFVWSEGARSRFIESLILEMPIPPVFMIEEESGHYSLVDGLQRISSYLHFRGLLNAPHLPNPVEMGNKLELTGCDIIDELNGLNFDTLPSTLRIRLKRAFLRVDVIKRGADAQLKYHLFKRLNTGGVTLTYQQIRNSTIRLLDNKFNEFLNKLSENSDFQSTTEAISTEQRMGLYDVELILRFFAMKNWQEKFTHEISEFLTEYMEAVSDPEGTEAKKFDYAAEEAAFNRTFSILNASLGIKAFAYPNRKVGNIVGFSAMQYEAMTIGLQKHLSNLNPEDEIQMQLLKEKLEKLKHDPEFISYTVGGGKNSTGPFKNRIRMVSENIQSIL